MKSLVLFVLCLFLPSALAYAEESDPEFRVLKQLIISQDQSAVVMVREGGHLIGQPFQVELRVRCGSSEMNPQNWPIQDSFSVCDLSPDSVKTNQQQTAVALKVKLADLNSYYNSVELGQKLNEVPCQKKSTIKKFSLKSLCN